MASYEYGYDDGFAEGYRKGLADGSRTPPEPPAPAKPTLKVTAVCADGTTPCAAATEFTGTKDSYEPGETVTLTAVPNKIAPPTKADGTWYEGTGREYTFLRWSDGDTSATRTVTLGETGETALSAVFDVVPIATAADLKQLLDDVGATANASEGKVYLQTADIDLSDYPGWQGIGLSSKRNQLDYYFKGAYNGGGHAVTGLTLYQQEYAGLFGMTLGAIIVDLSVDCDGIALREDFPAGEEYGGAVLVGYAGDVSGSVGKPTVIANVSTSGAVGSADHQTTHNTAGMVARADGPAVTTSSTEGEGLILIGCSNSASVFTNRASGMKEGGLVGYLMAVGLIRDCTDTGTLTTSRENFAPSQTEGIGGFVGNVGASRALYVHGGTADATIVCPASTTACGTVTGYMQNGYLADGVLVDAQTQSMPIGAGETRSSFLGLPAGDGLYRLLDSDEPIVFNTETVYKAFSNPMNGFSLTSAGDYIVIDTSVVKPTVLFNDSAASEEDLGGGVVKFSAA